jgi:integrase/quercetin dioxygenase-like cupin family protein
MSVKMRPWNNGEGWELDIRVQLPDGRLLRERKKAPTASKSAAFRWGQDRERELLRFGKPEKQKGEVNQVPTLEEFSVRFLNEYARANRQKPSGIAAKETIFRRHLIPMLGERPLNAITTADVQGLKSALAGKAPKTVNNVLTVLNTTLKTAVEWGVIDAMPCSIRLVKAPNPKMQFHDFEVLERLLKAAEMEGPQTLAVVVLGAEAGLRCGEMTALEWSDVDFGKGQLTVARSEWKGQVTAPKGGRIRHVPMSRHVEAALRAIRHVLDAAIAVMDQPRCDVVAALMQRLLERVEHELRAHGVGHFPAHDPTRKNIDDERGVDEAVGGADVREVRDPELIRSGRREVAIDQIRHDRCVVGPRRDDVPATPDRAPQAERDHEPLDRTARDGNLLATELSPDFLGAIHLLVLVPDARDLDRQRVVALGAGRPPRRIRLLRLVTPIRRWGDRQVLADRLDPVRLPLRVHAGHHHFGRRSSSAWAKNADAFRRMSLARLSSRFSRSSSLRRSRSLVVRPGRCPASRSAWRTQRRRHSVGQSSFAATDRIVAHCEGCSCACSKTILTARSFSSCGYLLGRPMGSILSRKEPSREPGPIHYTVIEDNPSVRVLRISYGAGEASTMHYHPDAVAVSLAGSTFRFTLEDGTTRDTTLDADSALFTPAETHNPQNIGEARSDVILVEFKAAQPGTAALPEARDAMAMTLLAEGPRASVFRITAEPSFSEPEGSTHEFDQIVIALEPGEVDLTIDGQLVRSTWARGDVQFIGRGVPHSSTNKGGTPVNYILVAVR